MEVEGERDASACMRRHQVSALAPLPRVPVWLYACMSWMVEWLIG
jgi:hypothetical protein